MNAFKEDETFSGYMCFVNSQAVGAQDVAMFIITLQTLSEEQNGAEIPVPKNPGLPPDLRMTMTDDLSLVAAAGGRSLRVSLSGGDPQIARKLLSDLAVLQFVKIQRLTK